MSDSKPIVHFHGTANFHMSPYPDPETGKDWEYARVYALDHPRLGRDIVRTSQVLRKFDDGSFETRNTVYKPFDASESPA